MFEALEKTLCPHKTPKTLKCFKMAGAPSLQRQQSRDTMNPQLWREKGGTWDAAKDSSREENNPKLFRRKVLWFNLGHSACLSRTKEFVKSSFFTLNFACQATLPPVLYEHNQMCSPRMILVAACCGTEPEPEEVCLGG